MVFQSRLEQSLLAFVTTLYIKKVGWLWNLMKFQYQLKFCSKFSRWISKISESKCERSSCIAKLFGLKVCLQRNIYILFVHRGLCFSVLYRTSADNYDVSVVQHFLLEWEWMRMLEDCTCIYWSAYVQDLHVKLRTKWKINAKAVIS